ncbi:VOC family protein [Kribbella sp. NBC_00382]|uniref:VOC family protein n=1 Tax=Kribbella sp. NBC_00382 TaxID=2975967 RepID=UPI002E1BDD82
MDHLVYATPDLAATVAAFTAATGLTPMPGGVHVGRGTRNELVGLGPGRYLEIIGPDLGQPDPESPRPFGIDELAQPRVVTWAIGSTDLDAAVAAARAAGFDPGEPEGMSRSTPEGDLLEWRLTSAFTEPTGLVPFLIDWGRTVHPSSRGLPQAELVSFMGFAPQPGEVAWMLDAVGAELALAAGEAGLSVVLGTPRGVVRLEEL